MTDDPATKSIPPNGDESSEPSPEPASFQLKPGDRVGNYVIREQVGEGGFAVVYAAEQEKPVRRKVALKIIKLGMDTKQVIARFEAERQALAMMDHPNVAKVFDAGVTDMGRPYFVMEYVPGEPITDYCERHRLSTRQRLNLFAQACQAVQHAHQKGIIHRDIKPSNVLVTAKEGEPVVKVIDFGVAKAISQRLSERTVYTEQGQLIGTPEYMSPEQAEMGALDIDTRTDVYSLGMVLYEMLVGALPFDPIELRRAALAEIQRIIREQEPPKPSTRLSSLAEGPGGVPTKPGSDRATLLRDLRGDLDWITMKALEKDRMRRYATASELAADVQRHLNGDPVQARKPSFGYVFGKLMLRERGKVVAALLVLSSLFLGSAMLAWYMETTRWDPIISARAMPHLERELAQREQTYVDLKENPPPTLDALLADPRSAFILARHHGLGGPGTDVQVLGALLNPGMDLDEDERVRAYFLGLDEAAWRTAVVRLADHAIMDLRRLSTSKWDRQDFDEYVDSEAARVLAGPGLEPSSPQEIDLSAWTTAELIDRRRSLDRKASVSPRPVVGLALGALAALFLVTALSVRSANLWLAGLEFLVTMAFLAWIWLAADASPAIVLCLFLLWFCAQVLISIINQQWALARLCGGLVLFFASAAIFVSKVDQLESTSIGVAVAWLALVFAGLGLTVWGLVGMAIRGPAGMAPHWPAPRSR